MNLDFSAKLRLAEKLKPLSKPFGFDIDPTLASLCACLGLQHELGKKEVDRLSIFFGVDPTNYDFNPWKTDIIINKNKIGLRLVPKEKINLKICHPDIQFILSKESFDSEGNLNQLIIYPSDVAANYKAKGFNLVIVPDWVRTTALEEKVNYLYTNKWEIESNIAKTQIQLMLNKQIPFSGTHDIVDHLLGGDIEEYSDSLQLLDETAKVYETVFNEKTEHSKSHLLVSYLIGVLLDDLAQPKWYKSPKHLSFVKKAVDSISDKNLKIVTGKITSIPNSFHILMQEIRETKSNDAKLNAYYKCFLYDLCG